MAKDENFGRVWIEQQGGKTKWYKLIHEERAWLHAIFQKVVDQIKPGTVTEIGCGTGEVYPSYFSPSVYTGVDLSKPNIDLAAARFPDQNFICKDVMDLVLEKAELAFAHAVIDHVKDPGKFILKMLDLGEKIFISSYRGYFPNLLTHRQVFSEEEGCFYNDVSALEVNKTFPELEVVGLKYPTSSSTETIIHNLNKSMLKKAVILS